MVKPNTDLREGELQKINLCFMNYLRKCFSKNPKKQKKFYYHNVDNLTNPYKYHSQNGGMVYCNSCGRLHLLSSAFSIQYGEHKYDLL